MNFYVSSRIFISEGRPQEELGKFVFLRRMFIFHFLNLNVESISLFPKRNRMNILPFTYGILPAINILLLYDTILPPATSALSKNKC